MKTDAVSYVHLAKISGYQLTRTFLFVVRGRGGRERTGGTEGQEVPSEKVDKNTSSGVGLSETSGREVKKNTNNGREILLKHESGGSRVRVCGKRGQEDCNLV